MFYAFSLIPVAGYSRHGVCAWVLGFSCGTVTPDCALGFLFSETDNRQLRSHHPLAPIAISRYIGRLSCHHPFYLLSAVTVEDHYADA